MLSESFVKYLEPLLFPVKLYRLAHSEQCRSIQWSDGGDSVRLDLEKLSKECFVPGVFNVLDHKHVFRQLSYYGFHRIDKVNKIVVFHHPNFLADRLDLVETIRRASKRQASVKVVSDTKVFLSFVEPRKSARLRKKVDPPVTADVAAVKVEVAQDDLHEEKTSIQKRKTKETGEINKETPVKKKPPRKRRSTSRKKTAKESKKSASEEDTGIPPAKKAPSTRNRSRTVKKEVEDPDYTPGSRRRSGRRTRVVKNERSSDEDSDASFDIDSASLRRRVDSGQPLVQPRPSIIGTDFLQTEEQQCPRKTRRAKTVTEVMKVSSWSPLVKNSPPEVAKNSSHHAATDITMFPSMSANKPILVKSESYHELNARFSRTPRSCGLQEKVVPQVKKNLFTNQSTSVANGATPYCCREMRQDVSASHCLQENPNGMGFKANPQGINLHIKEENYHQNVLPVRGNFILKEHRRWEPVSKCFNFSATESNLTKGNDSLNFEGNDSSIDFNWVINNVSFNKDSQKYASTDNLNWAIESPYLGSQASCVQRKLHTATGTPSKTTSCYVSQCDYSPRTSFGSSFIQIKPEQSVNESFGSTLLADDQLMQVLAKSREGFSTHAATRRGPEASVLMSPLHDHRYFAESEAVSLAEPPSALRYHPYANATSPTAPQPPRMSLQISPFATEPIATAPEPTSAMHMAPEGIVSISTLDIQHRRRHKLRHHSELSITPVSVLGDALVESCRVVSGSDDFAAPSSSSYRTTTLQYNPVEGQPFANGCDPGRPAAGNTACNAEITSYPNWIRDQELYGYWSAQAASQSEDDIDPGPPSDPESEESGFESYETSPNQVYPEGHRPSYMSFFQDPAAEIQDEQTSLTPLERLSLVAELHQKLRSGELNTWDLFDSPDSNVRECACDAATFDIQTALALSLAQ